MPHVLVTGGAGFFGGILKRHLLRQHYDVTSIDRVPDPNWHPRLSPGILGNRMPGRAPARAVIQAIHPPESPQALARFAIKSNQQADWTAAAAERK
jgi:nucleoside-diphosphate-sugar epimerase